MLLTEKPNEKIDLFPSKNSPHLVVSPYLRIFGDEAKA